MEKVRSELEKTQKKIAEVEAWKPVGFYEQLSKVGQLLVLNEKHKELTIQLQRGVLA